jgi:rhodanese-related sulfurtransferase
MRRTVRQILAILVITSGMGAAANAVVHRMDWIRRPLPGPNGLSIAPAESPAGPKTTKEAEANGLPPNHSPTQPAAPPLAGSNGNGQAVRPPAGFVDADAVFEHLSKGTAYFIDARDHGEYAAGHLRGAINVPASAIYDKLTQVVNLIGRDDLIIVYCGGGGCDASHNVADALRRDYGYANVLIHEKGWEEIEGSSRFSQCIVTGEEP